MIDEGIRYGMTSPPTRELIAKWAVYVKDQIKETHIRNAWRHEPYSWFPTCDDMKIYILFVTLIHLIFYSLYACSLLLHFQLISFALVILNWCL